MKIVPCEQGTGEWLKARQGIPTASRWSDIFTPTGQPAKGATARAYMIELAGERLTGTTAEHFATFAMQRGTELEPAARAWYEMATGTEVARIGFVTDNDGQWGCSPDGITESGGIEIKCPLRHTLLDALDRKYINPDHMLQMQAAMWIMDRSHWDYVLYSAEQGIPSVIWPVKRDDALCKVFAEHMPKFCEQVAEITKRIKAML